MVDELLRELGFDLAQGGLPGVLKKLAETNGQPQAPVVATAVEKVEFKVQTDDLPPLPPANNSPGGSS